MDDHDAQQDLPPYRANDLAKRWGLKADVVTAACRAGRLPGAFQPGGKLWLIPRSTIAALEQGEVM